MMQHFLSAHLPSQGSHPPLSASLMQLQLWLWASMWQSFPLALQHAKDGSLPWKPLLQPEAARLRQTLTQLPHAPLVEAVGKQLLDRAQQSLRGISAYLEQAAPHKPSTTEAVCGQWGSSRLLEYAVPNPWATAFVVPSLINRHTILDLHPNRSFMRYLQQQGIQGFLLDWGMPGPAETHYDVSDYILERLYPAFDRSARLTGQKPFMLGYCMGGMMALAAAQHYGTDRLSGLGLLATPWDFHKAESSFIPLDSEAITLLRSFVARAQGLPAWMLQPMFYRTDPWLFARKFGRFHAMPKGEEKELFMALEWWLNEGISLTAKVAETCLVHWAHENHPAKGLWNVGGMTIDPTHIRIPSFAVVPERDKVVPPISTLPLLRHLPGIESIHPAMGHVGIVMGSQAAADVWAPLVSWMQRSIGK